MSRVQLREDGNRIIILEPETNAICKLCGKVAELRPYGLNGEHICFECGMKDEDTTNRRIDHVLFGESL